METYTYKSPDGETVEVKPNLNREDQNLYVDVQDPYNDSACIGIVGKEAIESFIYASAVHGGLIDDGDELVLRKPAQKRPVPADGMYVKTTVGNGLCAVFVDGGKVYVHQYNSDHMVDLTEVFQTSEVPWKLAPMRRT